METKLKDNSKDFEEKKAEAIERALETIGGLMERYAKQNCPVDTGLLRNSIVYCLDGKRPSARNYRASYGSNKDSKGKRYSASSKKAGTVKVGFYNGEMPKEDKGHRSVYVGTNVEYVPIVEFDDKKKHVSGQAHFLRDSVANHIGEYRTVIDNELKKVSK